MPIPQPGASLKAAMLAQTTALPRKMAPVTLTGTVIELVPLDVKRDAKALHTISNGLAAAIGERKIEAYDAEEQIWRFMPYGPFADEATMIDYLQSQVTMPNGLALCVRDRATGSPIGIVTYLNNFPEHLKVEIGGIWYSPLAQRTNANLEATYLMLKHAFALGYRRIEWKCDDLNLRSRKAAMRMGFKFEGIQQAHLIVKGRNRDTAWFRILDDEWPDVQAQLEALLAQERD